MMKQNQPKSGRRQRPVTPVFMVSHPAEVPAVSPAVLEEILKAAGLEALD